MPPPLAVEIPVVSQPGSSSGGRGKTPIRPGHRARQYKDGPLPTKLSDSAPSEAHIVGRVIDETGVRYMLRIGGAELDPVDIGEILDYVSPLVLEEFEHRQFAEERAVLNALETEKQLERREKLERQKIKAKSKGTVLYEEVDSTDDVTGLEDEDLDRRQRGRPTYTHLFKRFKERQRRKRDLETGELLPLSGGEDDVVSTENDSAIAPAKAPPSIPQTELPKRRRRKRDKVTGKLLPLSPLKSHKPQPPNVTEHKRQRRKRHPLTGKLMPIGWHYDDNKDVTNTHEQAPQASTAQSFRTLSISEEHHAKRPRLASESSSSGSVSPLPTKMNTIRSKSATSPLNKLKTDSAQQHNSVVDLSTSDDEAAAAPGSVPLSNLKPAATPASTRKQAPVPIGISSTQESSPEPDERTSIIRPSTAWKASPKPGTGRAPPKDSPRSQLETRTSISHPSAANAVSPQPLKYESSEVEETADEAEEDEWLVGAILDHGYSDPSTHPPSSGAAPVMLYKTKWVGSKEPTWEPLESFGDISVITAYWKRLGPPSEASDSIGHNETHADTAAVVGASEPSHRAIQADGSDAARAGNESNNTDGYEDMEEGEYEIEAILAHHLSDPRTHPPELGKTPVMLYQVKWKGWEDPTWEPASSFEDNRILEEYHNQVGMQFAKPRADLVMSSVM